MRSRPSAAAEIDAPLETVWSVLTDTDRYPEWNPFVVRVECEQPPHVGTPIRLHVEFAGGKQVAPERITVVEPPYDDEGMRRP